MNIQKELYFKIQEKIMNKKVYTIGFRNHLTVQNTFISYKEICELMPEIAKKDIKLYINTFRKMGLLYYSQKHDKYSIEQR
jgi:hypothetical protein